MNSSSWFSFLSDAACAGGLALVSGVSGEFLREAFIVVIAAVTLFGVQLSWRAPRYRMSIEERAKDGKLTEEQARRSIRTIRWGGPAIALAGATLMGLLLLD